MQITGFTITPIKTNGTALEPGREWMTWAAIRYPDAPVIASFAETTDLTPRWRQHPAVIS